MQRPVWSSCRTPCLVRRNHWQLSSLPAKGASVVDTDLNPVSKAVTTVIVISAIVWTLWCTWVAFFGGALPLLGWRLSGGFIFGVVWLFFVDPFVVTIAYWASMVVTVPLVMLSEAVTRRRS